MEKQFDFISVGDITTDAFIRLSEAQIIDGEKGSNPLLCVSFGDKIPYEFVEIIPAVGNSANAAISATRLGLKSAFVSNIGNDRNGEDCLNTLKENGVNCDFIKIHKDTKTNYHYVLWYGPDRTILVKHTEFDYKMPDIGSPRWIYLSSMAPNSLPFHNELVEYIKARPEINLAYQPGTFQMEFGYEKTKEIYRLSKIFFCNTEEARRILKTANKDEEEINKTEIVGLLKMIRELGPKIVVITDGPSGAYSYDGEEIWFIPAYPKDHLPYDRTGAGDAFSSTFTSALALEKSTQEALLWGALNATSVIEYIGARKGLLTKEQIEKAILEKPKDFDAKRIL